jgi:hypothetical protein
MIEVGQNVGNYRVLEKIAQRTALAKAPADRFPSMAAFGEALLSPGAHVPLFTARADENASAVVRDARPMSRAEIKLHRSLKFPANQGG